jgi:hypothetical protein
MPDLSGSDAGLSLKPMKTRTWMLLGSLLMLSAIAQAHERTPTKPAALKLATQPKFVPGLTRATGAEDPQLACVNSATQEPSSENTRAPVNKPPKDTPAPRRPRRAGCDSFHCVALAADRPALTPAV